jgi:hypothetical protein
MEPYDKLKRERYLRIYESTWSENAATGRYLTPGQVIDEIRGMTGELPPWIPWEVIDCHGREDEIRKKRRAVGALKRRGRRKTLVERIAIAKNRQAFKRREKKKRKNKLAAYAA